MRAARPRLTRGSWVSAVLGTLLVVSLVLVAQGARDAAVLRARVQQERAGYSAIRIEQFIKEIERLVVGAVQSPNVAGPVSLDQRRADYLRLLRQAAAITELSSIDSRGQGCLRLSRLAQNTAGCRMDYSQDPFFREASAGRTHFSSPFFRNDGSEYYMLVAVPEPWSRRVTVVSPRLEFILDVLSQARVGRADDVYVVDERGQLVAHPDLRLVREEVDLSALPQVQSALTRPARTAGPGGVQDEPIVGLDRRGRPMLSAQARIDPPGWTVFAARPLENAAPWLGHSLLRLECHLRGPGSRSGPCYPATGESVLQQATEAIR